MYFARLKALTRSLRFQLMVWNASVVLVTVLATLFGLRESVRRALLDEMDQILYADMEEIHLALRERSLEELFEDVNRKAQAHTLQGWFARIIAANGDVLLATVTAAGPLTPQSTWRDGRPVTAGAYRLIPDHASSGGRDYGLVVGSSVEWIQADLAHIDRNCLLIGGLVLILAPLCGFWLAGRATQPMQEIVQTVRQLRPSNLGERLRLRGTDDELDRISDAFNRMLDRLGAYLQQKRDSLANAAHELRTPLAAIRSTVEVALSSDRSREDYEELLGSVIEECESLETLVNQLLLLAETEATPIRNLGERVRLDELVRTTRDMFEAVAEDKGVALDVRVAAGVTVEGQAHHLRQVLNNLIDNAIKFTPESGRVEVELFSTATQAILTVRDTGVGIAPDELPKVFERFFRSDRSRPRSGERKGTGLGLSICQAIIQTHGGEISIASELGAGTTVTVRLPLAAELA